MNRMIFEKILLFLAGGAVGGFTVGMIMKSKYEKIIDEKDEEIDEVAEIYRKRYEDLKQYGKNSDPDSDDAEEDLELPKEVANSILEQSAKAKNKEDIQKIVEKKGYFDYSKLQNEPERNPEIIDEYEPEEEDIVVISPDEFGELRDYEQQTLYYLRDKMLVDDEGHVVEDIGKWVSYEALDEFGAYGEADSVYVRNNHFKTDIEIFLRDETLATFSG